PPNLNLSAERIGHSAERIEQSVEVEEIFLTFSWLLSLLCVLGASATLALPQPWRFRNLGASASFALLQPLRLGVEFVPHRSFFFHRIV
ncbi:hypothetical protein L0128_16840, partial [candidate division KSB1 bacterium]|nr:hypothetical protein [candidate division KSB1 bacterium]